MNPCYEIAQYRYHNYDIINTKFDENFDEEHLV